MLLPTLIRQQRRMILQQVPLWYVISTVVMIVVFVTVDATTNINHDDNIYNHHHHSSSSSVLLQQEEQRRFNEEQSSNDDVFLYNDLSKYSIHYEKCQFVQMYDDNLAASQSSSSILESPLAMKHFVVYRLFPTDTCGSSSTNTCGGSATSTTDTTTSSSSYGTYTMTVEDYLYYTINYQKQLLEQSCNFCNAYCLSSSSSSSSTTTTTSPYCTPNFDCTNTLCNTCSSTCDEYYYYTTSIANGDTSIIDAANYIQCQPLNANQGEGDDNVQDDENAAVQYYIGPYCQIASNTKSSTSASTMTVPTSIVIGLFTDENCYRPVSDTTITSTMKLSEVLGSDVSLSYHLFKHTKTTSTTNSNNKNDYQANPMECLSCLEDNQNNNNQRDQDDVDDVNEMCENLYSLSAKCESPTGLQYGFIQMNKNQNKNNNEEGEGEQQQVNQVANEFMVCNFIQNLLYNSYTETGIINIHVQQDYIIRHITHKQQVTLYLLGLLFLFILGCIYYYHSKIQQIHPSTTDGIYNHHLNTITKNKNSGRLIDRFVGEFS